MKSLDEIKREKVQRQKSATTSGGKHATQKHDTFQAEDTAQDGNLHGKISIAQKSCKPDILFVKN